MAKGKIKLVVSLSLSVYCVVLVSTCTTIFSHHLPMVGSRFHFLIAIIPHHPKSAHPPPPSSHQPLSLLTPRPSSHFRLRPSSDYIFLLSPASSCFFLLLPPSSCFFLHLPSSCCFCLERQPKLIKTVLVRKFSSFKDNVRYKTRCTK